MKDYIKLSAICFLSIFILLNSSCSPKKTHVIDNGLGYYEFDEGLSDRNFREYDLSIYSDKKEVWAELKINGWMTGLWCKASLDGDAESIAIIYQENLADYGPTINMQFEKGDILFRLFQTDEWIHTQWEAMKPIVGASEEEPDGLCFVKVE